MSLLAMFCAFLTACGPISDMLGPTSRFVLKANEGEATAQVLNDMADTIRVNMRNAEPQIFINGITVQDGQLSIALSDADQVDAARQLLAESGKDKQTGQDSWTMKAGNNNQFLITPTKPVIGAYLDRAMDASVEVMRKRIEVSAMGTPTIVRQGKSMIVIEVSGVADPKVFGKLLGTRGKLEFKLVDERATQNIGSGFPNPGAKIYTFAKDQPQAGTALAVKRSGGIRGKNLASARQAFDQLTNAPVIDIAFDAEGARQFAEFSSNNVGQRFAIILNDEVISAPIFNEAILGGRAQISGNFSVEDATNLAIMLNSGSLPIGFEVLEAYTIDDEPDKKAVAKDMPDNENMTAGVVNIIAGQSTVIAAQGLHR